MHNLGVEKIFFPHIQEGGLSLLDKIILCEILPHKTTSVGIFSTRGGELSIIKRRHKYIERTCLLHKTCVNTGTSGSHMQHHYEGTFITYTPRWGGNIKQYLVPHNNRERELLLCPTHQKKCVALNHNPTDFSHSQRDFNVSLPSLRAEVVTIQKTLVIQTHCLYEAQPTGLMIP